MIDPPDNGGTEAGSLADILVLAGVPRNIIKLGEAATCTFTNFMEMKSKGLLDDAEIDEAYPLKVVTGQAHAPGRHISAGGRWPCRTGPSTASSHRAKTVGTKCCWSILQR